MGQRECHGRAERVRVRGEGAVNSVCTPVQMYARMLPRT